MMHPAALQALSTGLDNRPFTPTRQHGNETQRFSSRLLKTRMRQTPATLSRLLDLVVPESDAFFRRLAPEI